MTFKRTSILATLVLALVVLGCFHMNSGRTQKVGPLMIASKNGDIQKVKRLLSEGSDPNAQSAYGWTALMFASWQGHSEVVNLLLDSGANPNVISGSVPSQFKTVGGHPPTTALQEAIRNGHQDLAIQLLTYGNSEPDPGAVALAARENDMTLMEVFHSMGVNWNLSSSNAFYPTALCMATERNNPDLVDWLIERGADPNFVAVGQSPLKGAVEAQSPEITDKLLKAGANPNGVFDDCGYTPLYHAAALSSTRPNYKGLEEVIRILINAGAERSIETCVKGTPIRMVTAQIENSKKRLKEGESIDDKPYILHKLRVLEMLSEKDS